MASVTAWRGTVTKENHLYHLFRANPQKATDVMITLMTSMYLPTLDSYLSKEVPVREYDDDSRLHWDIVTSSRRNIPLVEARRCDGTKVTSGSANVGVGFEPFYLVFPTDWFAIGEVLWGNYNEEYPVIVKEDGRAEGTNTVYLVEPFGARGAVGIPAERLLQGERFSWAYAPIEDNFSRKVGDVRFSTPVSMSADWQHVRIQHKIGGKEIGKRLSANIPLTTEVNGKPVTKMVSRWMLAVTWQIEKTWSEYKNNSLDRGVSTIMDNGEVSNFGLSGLPNRQGAGYRQLKASGNYRYYTKFRIGLIDDALYALSAGKLNFNQRKFIVRTGERGAIQLSKAAKQEMSGWMPLYGGTSNVPYVTKNATDYAPNGVAIADFQVTKWIAANGVQVTIMIDSSKDDLQTNKIMHPLGGPAESYTYDISYAGDEDQPNVQKCMIKGQPELRGYQWGPFANPFTGEFNNAYSSFDEDAAVVHYKATQGILIYDTTRCITLAPAILQA
ncbi:MAG: hypothetical protein II661_01525 [Bacteroidales bacterium]|nr:hypothetical protein [Bacteroidales bacterium]